MRLIFISGICIALLVGVIFIKYSSNKDNQQDNARTYTDSVLKYGLGTLGYQLTIKDGIISNQDQYVDDIKWNLIACERNDLKEDTIPSDILKRFNWPDKTPDAQIITGHTVCAIRYPVYQHNKVKEDLKDLKAGTYGRAPGHTDHTESEESIEIRDDPTITDILTVVLRNEKLAGLQ